MSVESGRGPEPRALPDPCAELDGARVRGAGREGGSLPGHQSRGRGAGAAVPISSPAPPGEDSGGREPAEGPGGVPAAGPVRTGRSAERAGGPGAAEAGGGGRGCPGGRPEGGRGPRGLEREAEVWRGLGLASPFMRPLQGPGIQRRTESPPGEESAESRDRQGPQTDPCVSSRTPLPAHCHTHAPTVREHPPAFTHSPRPLERPSVQSQAPAPRFCLLPGWAAGGRWPQTHPRSPAHRLHGPPQASACVGCPGSDPTPEGPLPSTCHAQKHGLTSPGPCDPLVTSQPLTSSCEWGPYPTAAQGG